jgi:hypothetical protein
MIDDFWLPQYIKVSYAPRAQEANHFLETLEEIFELLGFGGVFRRL